MTTNDFCWVCEQGWVQSDDPIVTHPRTGEWAHDRCCTATTAGAMWRLKVRLAGLWQTLRPPTRPPTSRRKPSDLQGKSR